MPRKTLDWSYLPACPTCTAGPGEQCLDLRPVTDDPTAFHTIDYPHTDRRPRNRALVAQVRRNTGDPYPDRPGDRTKAVKAHLAGMGIDGVRVRSAAGTETTVEFGQWEPRDVKAALRKLHWAGLQIDTTPTTAVLTQQ